MDLGSAVRVLVRRWVVLVVGLILTLGVTSYIYTQSPPRYQATASMILLLPPNARGAEGAGSPFIYLPSGLQTLADIVVSGVESREQRRDLMSQGLTSQFELGVDVESPIITVSVEGLDPGNVIATRDGVIDRLEDELARVQREEDTPTRQTAHVRVYDIEDTPDRLAGNRNRGLLMALGVGGLITLMAAFAIDRGLLLYGEWRHRRTARPRRAGRSIQSDGAEGAVSPEQGSDDAAATGQAEPETGRSRQSTAEGVQSAVSPDEGTGDDGASASDERPSTGEHSDERPTAYERV